MHSLGIPLPHKDGFSKVKNAYIKSAYYSTCDSVDADETGMYGHWFYTTCYGIFGHEVKATKRSPPDNLTRWIITQTKGFTRESIEKINIGKTKGYNNKILVSNTDMEIGSIRDINKDHKKLPPDVPKTVIPKARVI